MSNKVQTIWLVQAYNSANRPVGPTWEVPSKIKPVRWAQQAHKGYDYSFTYQDTGKTQQQYDDDEFTKEQQAKVFEALAQLVTLALDEITLTKEDQPFILEPLPDRGIALCLGDFLVEFMEDRGKPVIPFGGVHYIVDHPFHECTCQPCQRLHTITEKYAATMQKAS